MKRGGNLSWMRKGIPIRRRPWAAALLLFLPPALAALFCRGPWALDELRLLQVTREMAARGSWLVPTLLGETYTHKPPLLLWLNRLLQEAGLSPWYSSRVLSIAAGAGTILFFYALAKRLIPRGAGAMAAALAVTPFFLIMTQLGSYDAALLFFLSAALYTALRKQGAWLGPGIFAGLAVLTKGPVALLFLAAWIPPLLGALHGRRAVLPGRSFLLFLLVTLAVVGSWFLPFSLATAGEASWTEALLRQSLGRISGSQGFGHPRPFWFYIPILPAMLRGLPPPAEGRGAPWKPWERIVLFSGLGTVLLFSFFQTKAPHYLLPILPWFLLLLPRAMEQLPPDEGKWILWAGVPPGLALVLFGTGLLDPLLALARPGPLEILGEAKLPALLGGAALVILPFPGRRLPAEAALAVLWTLLFLGGLPLLDRFQLPYALVEKLAANPPQALLVVHSRFGGSLTFLAGRAGLPAPPPSAFDPEIRGHLLGAGRPGVAAPVLKGENLERERILLLRHLSRPGAAALLTNTYRRKLRLEGARLPVAARAYFRGEEILLLQKKKKKKESSR